MNCFVYICCSKNAHLDRYRCNPNRFSSYINKTIGIFPRRLFKQYLETSLIQRIANRFKISRNF